MRKFTESIYYRLFIDLPQIVASSYFIINFLKLRLKDFSKILTEGAKLPLIFTAIIIIGAVILFIKSLENILNIFRKGIEDKQNKELKVLSTKYISSTISARNLLPNKDYVKRAYKKLRATANEWDTEAVLTSFNFYITCKEGSIKYGCQAVYYSGLKDALLTIYSHLNARNLEAYLSYRPRDEIVPFFLSLNNWKEHVTKIFLSLKEQIGSDFDIAVSSGGVRGGVNNVRVRYKIGEVEQVKIFDLFVEKVLNIDTNEEFSI